MKPATGKEISKKTTSPISPRLHRFPVSRNRHISLSSNTLQAAESQEELKQPQHEKDTAASQDQPQTPTHGQRKSSIFDRFRSKTSSKKGDNGKDKPSKQRRFGIFKRSKPSQPIQDKENNRPSRAASLSQSVAGVEHSKQTQYNSVDVSRRNSETESQLRDFVSRAHHEEMKRDLEKARVAETERLQARDQEVERLQREVAELRAKASQEAEARSRVEEEARAREAQRAEEEKASKQLVAEMHKVMAATQMTASELQRERIQFSTLLQEEVEERNARLDALRLQSEKEVRDRSADIASLRAQLEVEQAKRLAVEKQSQALQEERNTVKNAVLSMGEVMKTTQQVSQTLERERALFKHLLHEELSEKHNWLTLLHQREQEQLAELEELRRQLAAERGEPLSSPQSPASPTYLASPNQPRIQPHSAKSSPAPSSKRASPASQPASSSSSSASSAMAAMEALSSASNPSSPPQNPHTPVKRR